MQCHKCKKEMQKDWKVCPFCATSIPQKNKCTSCGKLIDPFWISCPFCDTPVEKKSEHSKVETNKETADVKTEKFCYSCGKRLYTDYMKCSICGNLNCLDCKDGNYRGVCITCGESKFKKPAIENSKQEFNAVKNNNTLKSDYSLRSDPVDVLPADKQIVFHLKGSLPTEYISNDYHNNEDGTIADRATGLIWQQSGSKEELVYKDARIYVNRLNSEKFAGYNNWRLPTIDELVSLLDSDTGESGLNVNSLFDIRQRYCWSSDRCSSDSMWNVHFGGGGVYWDGLESYHCVRAVR